MRSPDPLTASEKRKLSRFRSKLIEWYEVHGRDFPWRSETASTYQKICVEVLLQRTRAETVARIYESFFATYPSWDALNRTPTAELEKALKPIGLWQRRAVALKGLAKFAVSVDGQFPKDESKLAEIPAVGQYVSNAIQLFQHGVPKPLLDVNMARLIERYVRPRRLADIRHDPWLQEAAGYFVDVENAHFVNWASLDYASKVCISRSPKCGECTLRHGCWQYRQSLD